VSAAIEPSDAAPVAVFISYRQDEAMGLARALYERLAARFGRSKVFYDQESLRPGEEWAKTIHSESAGGGVLIALIGPRWAKSLTDRFEKGQEDYVRTEVEGALKAEGQKVLPTLIEGAAMPSKEDLEDLHTLQYLGQLQKVELSASSSWNADVERLIERLKQLGVAEATASSQPPTPPVAEPSPPPSTPPPATDPPAPAEPIASAAPAAAPSSPTARQEDGNRNEAAGDPPPDPEHYEELAEQLLDEAFRVVPFLGPGVNSCDRDGSWGEDVSEYLPDSDELARYLAQKIRMGGVETKGADLGLALASQSLSIKKGANSLYGALEKALAEEVQPPRRPPGTVHRFLANLPKTLRSKGAAERCQLIVTANYDNALERAFDDAKEPYDLAIYLPRKETFLHVPFDGKPRLVEDAASDDGFPIVLPSWRVKQTVIMKIHGAIDQPKGSMDPHGCVITEDDYIGYMSKGAIESIVPTLLLARLRQSRFLFLGHEMHDWSLRVFLRRVLDEGGLSDDPSWALQRRASDLDKRFWRRLGDVELFAADLKEYVQRLGEILDDVASARKSQT
jgi:hypothetical protein